jgi:3-phenylpropionate/trans-cinnamate dioxygenase ferredoxin reductase subunit
VATRTVDYLLIGGGIAALSCAEELRAAGADGSIVVVGREEDAPYERPVLSKGYLAGSSSRSDAFLKPASWWQENDVELMARKSVMKIDPDARVAKLPGGEELGFDKALLATGANVRRLRVDGSDVDGIHYLRAFGNSDAIRDEAADAESVVLVGGSWIGCEVAATLTSMGKQCSIVMLEDVVTSTHLGDEVGSFVQGLLGDRGVSVHGGESLASFRGADGRVTGVVCESGLTLDADLVVVGVGVTPDVLLARSLGAEVGETGGFKCSPVLETSVPGVFAAGDAAEYESVLHGRAARVEHFEVAAAHGKTAAHGMLGRQREHEVMPYFWSDLSDWATLEYVGIEAGSPVIRGSISDGDFTAVYVDDSGRVVGGATVGRSADLEQVARLVAAKAAPARDALADAPLAEL